MLVLDPRILWTQDCAFRFRNAATNKMKNHQGRLDGPWALNQMFSDEIEMAPTNFGGTSYRAETGIPLFLTTDPDAEVQVRDRIAPEAIMGVWTRRRDLENEVRQVLNRLPGPNREVLVQEFAPDSNGYSEWIVPRLSL
ncbi:DarT ssDNA thymidine ADP-ribosyltransferase family protein [Mesorhizobium ventifaucium]|uniref:DarT domain-containing protein n=1 Tax=Mesorhizobium ventifaucium TaxID=666020 RepID=A0ABN8K334_9HYPH|nr:DarT ssDNA thymidine ADP-ribosyltransferase family protein [Mesorhizobium ventifaucium]CAH2403648.1 hypothetical protein MES4922_310034 [Mesorhizobium ventifaucium]